MFHEFSMKNFHVDTILPAMQTCATVIVTQALGRLGHYAISPQTTVLVSLTAGVTSSFANNIFKQKALQYVSIPIGIAAGIGVNCFFYPATSFTDVLDPKGMLLVMAILCSVKFISENFSSLKKDVKNLENKIESKIHPDSTKQENRS